MNRTLINMSAACCFCLLLTLFPGTVPAETEGVADEAVQDLTTLSPEELMRIEVATVYSASKFEQKVTEAPSSVTIVTADEIRKYGHRTLADILRSVRSFYLSYDRNYSYAGVRGFGRAGDYNSRILLLIDGHRVNDNIYDSAPLGTEFPLDVDLIERVEVIRGPGSSLYGNSAFFAVINVITRRGEELRGGEVSAAAGSFDTYKGRATYGDRFTNGVEAFLSGSISDSNGDRLFFKEFADPASNNGITEHTDYDRSYSTLAKLSLADFTLQGLYGSRTKGIPTASFGTDFNDPRNKTTDAWWFVDLKYERELANRWNVTGRLFYDVYDYRGNYIIDGVVNRDLGKGSWWGGELKGAAKLFDRHKLVVGAEYRDNLHQDQKNFDEEPFTLFVDDKRTSYLWALNVQDEVTIFSNLLLNAGVRYDRYSTFGSTTNPRLALIYTPLEMTTFKILYGSAFRAPNVYELYYDDGRDLRANPDLGPEKIKTYELIYEQYLGNNLRGTVTGFYYEIKDLISQVQETDADGNEFSIFRNIDEVKAKGVETELEGKWEGGLTGRASYSFQQARDSATDQTLANSPEHLVKVNVTVPLMRDKLFIGVEEQFASRRKTLAGNFAKSFFLTNLTLSSRNLLHNLELSASVYNLFDYAYGNLGGLEHLQDVIQQDGLTFRVKVGYRF